MERTELLIVGGGAAGMAAALAARAAGGRVTLAERGGELGGVLPQCLHHGFGLATFGADLTGADYARRFRAMVESADIRVLTGTAVLALRRDRTALLTAPSGLRELAFTRCLLATGCRERPIGALPVAGTRPAGVLTAGAAQKMVNLAHYAVGREIVILGSGDIGQIMARQLTQLGAHILAMVEQRDTPGGMSRNRRECLEAYRIPVILRATVDEIEGVGRISGVWIRHLDTGRREHLACDTLITALGLIPERELLRPLEENGALPAWITLCGNCEHVHELVDSAAAQGKRAGAAAAEEGRTQA